MTDEHSSLREQVARRSRTRKELQMLAHLEDNTFQVIDPAAAIRNP